MKRETTARWILAYGLLGKMTDKYTLYCLLEHQVDSPIYRYNNGFFLFRHCSLVAFSMSYQKYFTCVVKNGTLYITHVPFSPNTCNMKSKINWKRCCLLKWEKYILILVYSAYGNWYLKCILFHIKGRTLELHWTAQYSIRLWNYAEKNGWWFQVSWLLN